ncbi:hypothetical protein KU306_13815 [Haloferax larsenii]|uniref:Uncharacterized protein n=1 Tax=Haloferax larsenii TaxID=302484 RepID=A0ABY5RCT3_HALLR|nr:hypothetical protein [Haloferax larsenii]ELZ77415.1 hypothetical protein C455_13800 [Haloferax larsenii JCM 13917]UVE49974.1 hypothetical protein KU306_13815 [Haloferax larsenii]
MQDAALSRALTDDASARQSLAIAGALEPARQEATSTDFDTDGVPFAASLAFVSTLFAHRRLRDSLRGVVSATDDSAWYPSGTPARVDDELVVRGAQLAVERLDASPSQLSSLGDVDVRKLRTEE